MHYQTEYALSLCRANDLLPIRKEWAKSGDAYILRAANGEKRWIFTGSAQTALANARWPKIGRNAVLWIHSRSYKNVEEIS